MNIKKSTSTKSITYGLVVVLVFAIQIQTMISAASEDNALTNRLPTYFPNTEELRADEMRVTALGTGLPTPLTRAQKSTSWMVELGNGDVFIFDIGTGSMENLFGY